MTHFGSCIQWFVLCDCDKSNLSKWESSTRCWEAPSITHITAVNWHTCKLSQNIVAYFCFSFNVAIIFTKNYPTKFQSNSWLIILLLNQTTLVLISTKLNSNLKKTNGLFDVRSNKSYLLWTLVIYEPKNKATTSQEILTIFYKYKMTFWKCLVFHPNILIAYRKQWMVCFQKQVLINTKDN